MSETSCLSSALGTVVNKFIHQLIGERVRGIECLVAGGGFRCRILEQTETADDPCSKLAGWVQGGRNCLSVAE